MYFIKTIFEFEHIISILDSFCIILFYTTDETYYNYKFSYVYWLIFEQVIQNKFNNNKIYCVDTGNTNILDYFLNNNITIPSIVVYWNKERIDELNISTKIKSKDDVENQDKMEKFIRKYLK